MGKRQVADRERAEIEGIEMVDHPEVDLAGDSRLLQLGAHQPGGEWRRVERHAQFLREIRDGPDVILMRVRQHHAEQVLRLILDELQIGENQVDAGIFVAAEGHAQIDHQPLVVAAIEIDVHADLARSTERAEQQFLTGFQNS